MLIARIQPRGLLTGKACRCSSVPSQVQTALCMCCAKTCQCCRTAAAQLTVLVAVTNLIWIMHQHQQHAMALILCSVRVPCHVQPAAAAGSTCNASSAIAGTAWVSQKIRVQRLQQCVTAAPLQRISLQTAGCCLVTTCLAQRSADPGLQVGGLANMQQFMRIVTRAPVACCATLKTQTSF